MGLQGMNHKYSYFGTEEKGTPQTNESEDNLLWYISVQHIMIHFNYNWTYSFFLELFLNCSLIAPVQFNHSVVSNSLWPQGLQHARLPCPSPSPRVCPSSCTTTISSSVALFSFCLQSFPASEFFPMTQLLASGGQSIAASDSASVLPKSIQGWFPLYSQHFKLKLCK